MFQTYDEMLVMARRYAPMKIAVAGAQEDTVLAALKQAEEQGFAESILVGDKEKIEALALQVGYDLKGKEIVDVPDPAESALEAVKMVSSGRADILMKGILQTSTILKAVLDRQYGLRASSVISHLFLIRLEGYHKFLSLTDGGINIAPSLDEQKAIMENAISFYHLMGLEKPKIAVLASLETLNEKVPATLSAALLAKMGERGQIRGAVIDGPLAFDNAVSAESVREKNIVTPVGGDADVLLVPHMDMGNGLFKGLVYFGKGVPAAVVLGTRRPVIVTSRADSARCKFLSIALNVLYAGKLREKEES